MATNNTKLGDGAPLTFALGDKAVKQMYLGETLIYELDTQNIKLKTFIEECPNVDYSLIDDLL